MEQGSRSSLALAQWWSIGSATAELMPFAPWLHHRRPSSTSAAGTGGFSANSSAGDFVVPASSARGLPRNALAPFQDCDLLPESSAGFQNRKNLMPSRFGTLSNTSTIQRP